MWAWWSFASLLSNTTSAVDSSMRSSSWMLSTEDQWLDMEHLIVFIAILARQTKSWKGQRFQIKWSSRFVLRGPLLILSRIQSTEYICMVSSVVTSLGFFSLPHSVVQESAIPFQTIPSAMARGSIYTDLLGFILQMHWGWEKGTDRMKNDILEENGLQHYREEQNHNTRTRKYSFVDWLTNSLICISCKSCR